MGIGKSKGHGHAGARGIIVWKANTKTGRLLQNLGEAKCSEVLDLSGNLRPNIQERDPHFYLRDPCKNYDFEYFYILNSCAILRM